MGDLMLNWLVGDFTDTTEGSVSLELCRFLWRLLWLSLHLFISPFVRNLVSLFLLVSKDGQTELAAKVHEGAVVCWDRDHVPGLNNLPVALETASVFNGQRNMARQTYSGAEELRRSFSLESRLTFQQNLRATAAANATRNWGLWWARRYWCQSWY